jgi:hypothetical protein
LLLDSAIARRFACTRRSEKRSKDSTRGQARHPVKGDTIMILLKQLSALVVSCALLLGAAQGESSAAQADQSASQSHA